MKRRVLLVIDMLEDFISQHGKLYCGPASEAIVPFVKAKVEEVLSQGGSVVFICDAHEPGDREFTRFPAHCVEGTAGAQIIAPLRDAGRFGDSGGATGQVFVVKKKRYSGFYGTDLENILKRLNPNVVEVVGVCTNICVLYTVEELCNRDYDVRIYREGVASFDQGAHEWAIDQMEKVLGAVVL